MLAHQWKRCPLCGSRLEGRMEQDLSDVVYDAHTEEVVDWEVTDGGTSVFCANGHTLTEMLDGARSA